jgi:hypothetical protein
MKEVNRKKLATIKGKILNGQFSTMSKKYREGKPDKDYETALRILGDAMSQVERMFGDVD